MSILASILILSAITATLVGMISPRLVLPGAKNPTRPLVIGVNFLVFVVGSWIGLGQIEKSYQDHRTGSPEFQAKKALENMSDEELNKLQQGNVIPTLRGDSKINGLTLATMKKQAKEEQKRRHTERLLTARAVKFGRAPERSSWDGNYTEVEKYLKQRTHDPSSVVIQSCTEVTYDQKKGWVVGCQYRARTAFGALLKSSSWFIIRQQTIVEMLPYSAYQDGRKTASKKSN